MESHESALLKKEQHEQIISEKIDYIKESIADAYCGLLQELRGAVDRACEHAGIADHSDDVLAEILEECLNVGVKR